MFEWGFYEFNYEVALNFVNKLGLTVRLEYVLCENFTRSEALS